MNDEDAWFLEFNKRAGPKLKALFAPNMSELPSTLADRLDRLTEAERSAEDRK